MQNFNKPKKTIFVVFVVAVIIVTFFNMVSNSESDSTSSQRLADGFTIEAYDVTLDVGLDNKIGVTETITVYFTTCDKHGIYKFTPYWLEYTGKDGNTIKRKSIISNYRAIGDPYSTDKVKKKARIRIGSADEYVGCGNKTYTIAYTYDMGKDPFKGFDELIFHAYGDYWGTEIKNATININMPKSIEGYNVSFFTDKYRENEVTEFVDYEINGNKLTAKFNQEKYEQYNYGQRCVFNNGVLDQDCEYNWYWQSPDYYLNSALTVDIELPEGYFVGGSWNYGWGSFIIFITVFILTGITIYKWFKFGKNHEKRVPTVEFYPPDDLNSAQIGYIYNKRQLSKKLTISLIVELASKGYIKIDNLKGKNKKENIVITNLVPILKKPVEFEKTLPNREIQVRKLKNPDMNLSTSENTLMTYLFKKGDTKVLKSNIDKFLELKDNLINKGYIEILSDNESERYKDIESKKQEYEEALQKYKSDLENRTAILSKLPLISSMEQVVYDELFKNKDVVVLSEHKTFYKVFSTIEFDLISSLKNKVNDENATNQIGSSIWRSIAVLSLSLMSYSFVEDLDPHFRVLYSLSFLCIFINLFFTIFMKRKTEYGEYITARVKGFRNFLLTAEKSRLEALVAENPRYFYDILPYTYVMNISKKWIKKFEDIPMPELDIGNFDYKSDYLYSSLYDSVYLPPVSNNYSSSSGCSSCGGGCSSCGGGCSSCGGGGSW